jgi:hypothetical protein
MLLRSVRDCVAHWSASSSVNVSCSAMAPLPFDS